MVQQQSKKIRIEHLRAGMQIVRFLDIPVIFSNLNMKTIEFLRKLDFSNIVIERQNDPLTVDADDLKVNDRIIRFGVFQKPILVRNDQMAAVITKVGFRELVVFALAKPKSTDTAISAENKEVPEKKPNKPPVTKKEVKKRISARESLHKLQDTMAIAEKTVEKGKDIVSTVMDQSRRGVFRTDETKLLAEEIIANINSSKYAISALSSLKNHDEFTFRHCIDVANQLTIVCKDLFKIEDNELKMVAMGGLLHDIGKSQIPQEILNKPGVLDETETRHMRMHPIFGAQIMNSMGFDKKIINIAYYHHTKKNGNGYPNKPYEKIGDLAKICALADVYQALVTKRPYKPSYSPHTALDLISQWSAENYDEELTYKFIQSLGVYPVGTLVRLSNYKIGFVTGWENTSIRPQVVVFIDETGSEVTNRELIDLANPEFSGMRISEILDHREYLGDDALTLFMNLEIRS